jgi:hypothetical protein
MPQGLGSPNHAKLFKGGIAKGASRSGKHQSADLPGILSLETLPESVMFAVQRAEKGEILHERHNPGASHDDAFLVRQRYGLAKLQGPSEGRYGPGSRRGENEMFHLGILRQSHQRIVSREDLRGKMRDPTLQEISSFLIPKGSIGGRKFLAEISQRNGITSSGKRAYTKKLREMADHPEYRGSHASGSTDNAYSPRLS